MKHIIIGDIHGNPIWKDIVEKYILDDVRYVFLGDYFDSFEYTPLEQIKNFEEIYEFSKKNDCVLLMGNHDLHYLTDIKGVRCSGYNGVTQLLIDNFQIEKGVKLIDLFDYTYSYKSRGVCQFICSHAGLTNTWLENNNLTLDSDINTYIKENIHSVAYDYTEPNKFGDSIYQGPLWVRPNSLEKDNACGMPTRQIVGHTRHNIIHCSDNLSVWYIDNFEPNKKVAWYLECIDELINSVIVRK